MEYQAGEEEETGILRGTCLQVPPREGQIRISFTRNFVNVGLSFQSLPKANTKVWS